MLKSGKQWPIFIAVAIFGVVGLSYWTIKETMTADLSQSDLYMSYYQNVDENINDIIAANIAFDKEYTLKLVAVNLGTKEGRVIYEIRKKDGTPVNDANVKLVLSRPVNDAKDIVLKPTKIEDGKYYFENIQLPKKGRWNLMLKVDLNQKRRYYNLKADTRSDKAFEY